VLSPRDALLPACRDAADISAYHLAAIIEAAEDAIISKDLNGMVTSWNPAAEQIFGYSAQEMIGRPILRVIPPDRMWEETMILDKIRSGQQVRHYESQRLTKSGALIAVALTISPIHDAGGNVIGASKIVRDISAEKELERVVEEAKDHFISNVSHELRTPLTGIRASLKLLQIGAMKDPDPRSASLLRIANDNSDRLLRLVEELLDFQRLTAETSVQLRSCRLSEITYPAIEAVSATAELHDIRLVVSLQDGSDDIALEADPERLQQVLLNLLSNALKYSPKGSKVELEACGEEDALVIRVRDEGRGIPGVALKTIFERFEQVEKADARCEGGVGLGLAISRRIVEEHGGRIWAERNDSTRPGTPGSTFALRLPL
jgi:PAS domain S-box-containing protein